MTFSRRQLLAAPLALQAQEGIKRTLHRASPAKGVAVWSFAYYTEPKGVNLRSVEQRISRSDTIDVAFTRESKDNGRTWSKPVQVATGQKRPGGMWRKHLRAGVIHPRVGHLVEFWNEGVLPTDDPLEGLRQWNITYRVGGRVKPLLAEGSEFTPEHPLPGVFRGKNCAVVGDQACVPVADGLRMLVPIELTLFDAEGKLANPGGGYTYHDSAVLIGDWKGGQYHWHMTTPLKLDPKKSTRGLLEPTIIPLLGKRWLMVMRASNDRKPQIPCHRWYSISEDTGETWPPAAPWTFSSGDLFFSPSACSQLLKHSSGRIFWLGNISQDNPRGNWPRYPFWIGEVDLASGLLRRESLRKVDDRQAGEAESLMLSNFYAREDRVTKEIVLHMSRLFPYTAGWAGDAFDYRIKV